MKKGLWNPTLIAFIMATLIGGNNAIAVRFSNVELPPFFGAAIRFAGASLLLLIIMRAWHLPMPKGHSLTGIAVFGLLNIGISYALLYWGLVNLTAGLTMLILTFVPLFTHFFAVLHNQEKFHWQVLMGSFLVLFGIAFISLDQIHTNIHWPSFFAIFLAAVCFAEASVIYKMIPQNNLITVNALAMMVGAFILAAMSLIARERPIWPTSMTTWISVVYLILLGSIGMFMLILYVLKHWTASKASYQVVLMPIVTVLSAAWLLGEPLTMAFLVGGLVVLVGVYIGVIASNNY